MNQYNEELQDPKAQGQPPPYTQMVAPQVMRPTNMMHTGEHMLAPVGQPMHGGMGQSIPIQQGTMMQPIGYHGYAAPVVVPMVVGNQMGPKPAGFTCQSCQQVIVTRVESKANTKTHMFAAMLCFMCCWPCAVLPYFLDSCRNADHYCPNCSAYIGSYVH